MERYIIFRDSSGRELLSYSERGTHPGELEATISLLAYEKGIPAEQISATLEERQETTQNDKTGNTANRQLYH